MTVEGNMENYFNFKAHKIPVKTSFSESQFRKGFFLHSSYDDTCLCQ